LTHIIKDYPHISGANIADRAKYPKHQFNFGLGITREDMKNQYHSTTFYASTLHNTKRISMRFCDTKHKLSYER